MVANILTLSRLGFLVVCVWLLYQPSVGAKWGALGLILFIIFIDAIDGTIARQRGEASPLGAILDIAIDRVVENVYWVTFAHLQLVPIWAALLVVSRGILTDAVRGFALSQGFTPFAMMQTKWGKWLVSHRFMRAVAGLSKVILFAGLATFLGLRDLWAAPHAYADYLPVLEQALLVLTVVNVGVNLARGVPVLIESYRFFKDPNLKLPSRA